MQHQSLMPKVHPAANLFPLLEGEEFQALVESIRDHGQTTPCVMWGNQLVDGRNRWRACLELNKVPDVTEFYSEDETEVLHFIIETNIQRRHLTPSQRAMLAVEVVPLFEAVARKKQAAQGHHGIRGGRPLSKTLEQKTAQGVYVELPPDFHLLDNSETSTEVEGNDSTADEHPAKKPRAQQSRDIAAKSTHANRQYVQDAKKISFKSPELAALVKADKITIPDARKIANMPYERVAQAVDLINSGAVKRGKDALAQVKLAQKHQLADQLNSKPIPVQDGTFDVIVIDPPWRYETRAEDVTHRGRNPYPDMSIDEICALPVGDRAEPNCILWLWTTNSFMREAFQCLDAWGFQHKTILTWAKDRMGTGDWLRGKTEHCLLAVRGRPTVLLTNQTTLLEAKLREHSRKPDEFYSLVEDLCPGKKLEFFSRQARPGFVAWGAETGQFDE